MAPAHTALSSSTLRPGFSQSSASTSPHSVPSSELAHRQGRFALLQERKSQAVGERATAAKAVAVETGPRHAPSQLPERWNTANLEDDFRRHTARERTQSRPKVKTDRKRKLQGRASRTKNVLDSYAWGIQRGKHLRKEEQALLCQKYQDWLRIKSVEDTLHSERPEEEEEEQEEEEEPNEIELAAAAGISVSQLRQIIEEGPRAADLLLAAVQALLNKLSFQQLRPGMEMEDVFQEAQRLWLDAAEVCDSNRSSLTTFGTLFVKQRLPWAVGQLHQTLERNKSSTLTEFKIGKAITALEERLERQPTVKEIAAKTGFPERRVKNILQTRRQEVSADSISSESKRGSDQETVGEALVDEALDDDSIIRPYLKRELRSDLDRLLETCMEDEMDRNVCMLVYGLDDVEDSEGLSYKQIGRLYGVSHETIRKRFRGAIQKLKDSPDVQELLSEHHKTNTLKEANAPLEN